MNLVFSCCFRPTFFSFSFFNIYINHCFFIQYFWTLPNSAVWSASFCTPFLYSALTGIDWTVNGPNWGQNWPSGLPFKLEEFIKSNNPYTVDINTSANYKYLKVNLVSACVFFFRAWYNQNTCDNAAAGVWTNIFELICIRMRNMQERKSSPAKLNWLSLGIPNRKEF